MLNFSHTYNSGGFILSKIYRYLINHIYFRFMLSFLLILIIPCLSMFFMRYLSMKMLQQNMQESNELTLNKNAAFLEEELGRISHTIEELAGNMQIRSFLSSNVRFEGSDELYKARDAAEVITYYLQPLKYDSCIDIMLYNSRNNTIVSSEIPYSTFPYFYGSLLAYPGTDYTAWEDAILNAGPGRFYLKNQAILYNGRKENALTLVQPVVLSGHKSAIIALIDGEWLTSLFSDINVAGGMVYIKDSQDRIIASTAALGNSEYRYDTSGSTIEYTYFCTDPNWSVTTAVPKQYFVDQTASLQDTSFFSIGFSLLFGLFLTMLFSSHNTKPIRDIHHMLTGASSSQPALSYDYVKKGVSEILQSNQELKTVLSEQKVLLRSVYIRELIKGEIIEKEHLQEMAKHYQIRIDGDCFLVAVICLLQDGNPLCTHSYNELTGQNVLINSLASALPLPTIYSYNQKDNEIVLLLGQNSADKEAPSLKTTLTSLTEQLTAAGIHFISCAGTIKSDPSNIYESYIEAMSALHASDWSNTTLQYYEDVNFTSGLSFYYPSDVEAKLIRSIRHGDEERIRNITHHLYNDNFQKRFINRTSFEILLDCIFYTVLKLSEKINFYELYSSAFLNLKKVPDMQASFVLLEELLVRISETHYAKQQSLSDEIMHYMQEHYKDSALTLNELAEHFGTSENAMYEYFKKTWNKTFASMLEELRINRSLSLIKSGTMTIEEIASASGYNSSHSYRRAFKRVLDCTPTEYREQSISH